MDNPVPLEILCVDDEEDARWVLSVFLRRLGYLPTLAETGAEALDHLAKRKFDMVLLDVCLQDINGYKLLEQVCSTYNTPVVMLTGYGDVMGAARALRSGAVDYVIKPFDHKSLAVVLRNVLTPNASSSVNRRDPNQGERRAQLVESAGNGKTMRHIIHQVENIAPTELTVLLEGETGTGKELIARAIHDLSVRRGGPFIVIDCGSIPESLIEGELFGHQKGAYTGAVQAGGLFAAAGGGTLFLDEIDSLPLEMQTRLLRVIETREYRPLGTTQFKKLDIRIVAGSIESLKERVKSKVFRADLYYRLAEYTLLLPPLRRRKEDIPDLVRHFLSIQQKKINLPSPLHVTQDGLDLLMRHDWGGNVRELRNTLARAMYEVTHLTDEISGDIITQCLSNVNLDSHAINSLTENANTAFASEKDQSLYPAQFDIPLHGPIPFKSIVKAATQRLEERILVQTLLQTEGNKALAARRLGLDYKTFAKKLKASPPPPKGHKISQKRIGSRVGETSSKAT